jgi:hypothetical protein
MPSSKPLNGLSAAATVGLGVSMGILAFLVVAGVLYAVFGRYVKKLRRDRGRGGMIEGRGRGIRRVREWSREGGGGGDEDVWGSGGRGEGGDA